MKRKFDALVRTIKFFEIYFKVNITFNFCLAWCPNNKLYLIAVGVGSKVCLINPYIGDRRIIEATNQVFESFEEDQKWKISEINGVKIEVLHDHEILDICWHSKGDYFGVISGISSKTDVWFHQISTRKSSKPFSKTKGIVQRILFHPTRLLFYVATQRFIKVFNLGYVPFNVKFLSKIYGPLILKVVKIKSCLNSS